MQMKLTCRCCICGDEMNWFQRYGLEGCCCGKECFQEFDWRRALGITGKEYYPDPKNPKFKHRLTALYWTEEKPP